MHDLVPDLTSFIDRSPTPYHAVAEAVRRLGAAGFEQIEEKDLFDPNMEENLFGGDYPVGVADIALF